MKIVMKAQKRFIATVSFFCLLAVSSCYVSNTITTSQDAETDFTKYKTFAWLPDKTDTTNLPYNNEIIRNNIRNYFGHRFADRGYTVNLEAPDILLGIVVSGKKKEKTQYTVFPSPYYYGRYYYGSIYYIPYHFDYYYRYYPSFQYPADYLKEKIEYVEGSITLNVFDRNKKKLVWSGTARSDIYDPAYINKNIHPAIDGIMKKYPVKPIGK
jgi:hypothetical protein